MTKKKLKKQFISITEDWKTYMQTDAMYFHSARQAHERAKESISKIQEAEDYWNSLNEKYENILSEHDDDLNSAMSELEPIAIQIENAHYGIGEAQAPLLKEISVVHILCCASLEAHINTVAKDTISGKKQKLFERLSLEAKWLFLPKILGLSGFELGCEPFQSFSKLLKYRNELIHYKGLKEKWVYGSVPQFINQLGLTIEDSTTSLSIVVKLISKLAHQRKIKPPYWLRKDLNEMSYFEIDSG
jgi:hypothetical protein